MPQMLPCWEIGCRDPRLCRSSCHKTFPNHPGEQSRLTESADRPGQLVGQNCHTESSITAYHSGPNSSQRDFPYSSKMPKSFHRAPWAVVKTPIAGHMWRSICAPIAKRPEHKKRGWDI